mmetsp:Transcript_7530/g.21563  ORF Transcript_7530/g.21563 Transcript_7530/m.21563 type:complete len:203 (-) Transcript_7530:161-769(-)
MVSSLRDTPPAVQWAATWSRSSMRCRPALPVLASESSSSPLESTRESWWQTLRPSRMSCMTCRCVSKSTTSASRGASSGAGEWSSVERDIPRCRRCGEGDGGTERSMLSSLPRSRLPPTAMGGGCCGKCRRRCRSDSDRSALRDDARFKGSGSRQTQTTARSSLSGWRTWSSESAAAAAEAVSNRIRNSTGTRIALATSLAC